MVGVGMGSTKRGLVWCVGLLVAGLVLLAAEADFCSEDCRGKTHFLGCARRCRSQLEVLAAMAARLSDACQDFCHSHEHFDWCVRRCRFGPHLRLAAAGGESEEASGGGNDDLRATAAARIPDRCVFFCGDRVRVEDFNSCLFTCRTGAPVHHKFAGGGAGESTTQEEEEEEAPGGAVHVRAAAAQVQHEAAAAAQPMNTDPCEAYCKTHARDFPAKYDVCVRQCRSGGHPGGETMAQDEEAIRGSAVDVSAPAANEAVAAGARPMKNTDPCDDYCVEQTRYFPRPGQFFDCVEECHAGHGRLAGDGRSGILRRVKQES
ncbi:hypothetical protein VPH35_107690 [Triticum aestivum]|uniref:uncharacterized protein n=1 Tax=Triticum aestivum TaxID=4565 RepID=UPI00084591A5|nr:uncharacterized protein LOC123133087 [Triticum aestivum]